MADDKTKLFDNFEKAKVTVQLAAAGDVPTATSEKEITAPEIMILRSIHGKNCIRNIRIVYDKKKGKETKLRDWDEERKAEYNRLVNFYGITKLKDLWPNISSEAEHFKPNFIDYGITQKIIDDSLRGVGALEKLEITEGLIRQVIASKKVTVENVIAMVKLMGKTDKEIIINELKRPSESQTLSELNHI